MQVTIFCQKNKFENQKVIQKCDFFYKFDYLLTLLARGTRATVKLVYFTKFNFVFALKTYPLLVSHKRPNKIKNHEKLFYLYYLILVFSFDFSNWNVFL